MFTGLEDLGRAYLSFFLSPTSLMYGLGGALVGIIVG